MKRRNESLRRSQKSKKEEKVSLGKDKKAHKDRVYETTAEEESEASNRN